MPRFAISILTYNALPLAKRCIESVLKYSNGTQVLLLLTANGNTEAANYFREVADKCLALERSENEAKSVVTAPVVMVIEHARNEGFIAPNRAAFEIAVEKGCEFFVMLNDDMTVIPGWLEKLAEPFVQYPTAALSGPEGNCSRILPNFHGTSGAFEYLEGSCLCCKTEVVRKIGLFPPELSGAYGEDSCLSLRVRERGYTIHRVKLPMPHVRGATSSQVPIARTWQENNHAWLRKRFLHYLKVRHFDFPIFIKRTAAWGDALLVTPIIRALRQQRPLSPIYVESDCCEVFRDNPHVFKFGRGMPVPKDSLVIDLNMAYESMREIHIVDAYAKVTAQALGGEFEVTDRSLDFYCRPSDTPKTLYSPGAKVAVVHAGPVSWRSKEWGAERFQVVTKSLIAEGWQVILVGSSRVAPVACSVDLRGLTTIHQLAAVIGAANLFIGLDSFPLHLAQAMGTPAVGIFGITWSKYILTADNTVIGQAAIGLDGTAPSAGLRHRTVNSREVDDGGAAIATITPDEVLKAVNAIQSINQLA